MARSRDVPSKKPAWTLFAGAKKSEDGSAGSGGDVATKTGSKRKEPSGSDPVAKPKKSSKSDDKNDDTTGHTKIKKKRRFKAATVSKREINKAQKHGNQGIATQPTDRLIREITSELGFEASRFEPRAIRALIEATEHFTTDYLRLTDVLAAHGGRLTLMKQDTDLASSILLGKHLLQEENGSMKARLGVLKAMRRDSRSIKNDEKLVPSRDRDNAIAATDEDEDLNADGE